MWQRAYALAPSRIGGLLDYLAAESNIIIGIIVSMIFTVSAFWASSATPSYRRRILQELEQNSEGHTLDEWVKLLQDGEKRNQGRSLLMSAARRIIGARSVEEEILAQPEKQVYRGKISVTFSERGPKAKRIFKSPGAHGSPAGARGSP